MKNILQKLKDEFSTLSKKHQMLASYILQNSTEVAFMTSVELAKAAKVSNATVTRFTITLGFEGFQEFQENIRKNVIKHYSSKDEVGNLAGKGDNVFEAMLEAINLIPSLYTTRDTKTILQAAECIIASEKVLITGYQWCDTLVTYTNYELGKFKKNVHKLVDSSLASYDLIHENPSKTCAIVFALPRYPTNLIEQLKKLKEQNIPIILFTDEIFPYAKNADYLFTIDINSSLPTVLPLVMMMLIVQEIISRVIVGDPTRAKQRVAEFESNAHATYKKIEELL